MNNLNIWTSYHLPEIESYYNLKENDNIKLFCTSQNINEDNINSLNKYYCELCTMYYVWKNYPSEYVGFQHYRYLLTSNDIEPLNNGYDIISEECFTHNYFNKLKKCGVNDYIIIKCIEYISSYTGINKSEVYKVLYDNNSPTFLCNTFICKYEIFYDLCKFIFGLLEYLIGNWKNEQNIIDNISLYKEYFYNNNCFYNLGDEWNNKNKCEHGWSFKVNDGNRFYIFLFEWLIPFYCACKQYKLFNISSELRYNQYKYIITNANNTDINYETFLHFHRRNIFTGVRNIFIYNYCDTVIDYLLKDMGDTIFGYCFKYMTLFENEDKLKKYISDNDIKQENIYTCKTNEFIDVNSSFDFYKNNKYKIKTIKL